jgi:hypothetical protein
MFQIIETKLVDENVLNEVMRRKDEKKHDFNEMITEGKTLVSRRDVTDTTHAIDKIKVGIHFSLSLAAERAGSSPFCSGKA